jgi:UDP-N-acetylmuramyl-tripeptide synthetase
MHLLRTPVEAARWLHGRVAGQLHCDSRRVRAGDGFIAWPGAATDGRRHVPAAIGQGATACLVEQDGASAFGFDDQAIAAYPQLKAATGPIAAEYYAHPSEHLAVLAVTGTNGKTSTAWWLAQALSNLAGNAWPCGVVGTLGVGRPPLVEYNGLTTPDPVLLQARFRDFVAQGVKACAIEASSVGIVERRLDGTRIRTAIFTNFTHDHLDYHGSMDGYWAAKAELFAWPGLEAAVVNIDDGKGAQLADRLQAEGGLALWTVSCERAARLQAVDVGYGAQGLVFTVAEGTEQHRLQTGVVGQYNVSNLLGVIAAMRTLGVPLADAVRACEGLLPVPGRMERLQEAGKPLVAVDYAHTPDALDKALQALQPLAQQRGGVLWCVFGCGGDRDAAKRPLMGAVAQKHAGRVVVTSDNPRSEQPETIVSQILRGLSQSDAVIVQPDRARAIAQTIAAAAPSDVILLAGKGHEDYQEVAGIKHPFDDRAHAAQALAARSAS